MLADQDAPKKQRHTARRIWQRFVAEHGATVSEVTVSRYVARRRVELGLVQREVSIPQTHLAGAEAEVDFGEFYATVAGVWVKCWMVVMRLSHSGRAFQVAFGTQAQEAFVEGHVLVFEHFGGVEGEIGRFRRRHLVPVPKVDSLAALNELIAAGDLLDDGRSPDVTEREERASIAIAANLPFSGWGSVFPDPRRVAAIVDPRHLQRPYPRNRHPVLPSQLPYCMANGLARLRGQGRP